MEFSLKRGEVIIGWGKEEKVHDREMRMVGIKSVLWDGK
jgi:hypothetical protein